jgi:hypothetical protein
LIDAQDSTISPDRFPARSTPSAAGVLFNAEAVCANKARPEAGNVDQFDVPLRDHAECRKTLENKENSAKNPPAREKKPY